MVSDARVLSETTMAAVCVVDNNVCNQLFFGAIVLLYSNIDKMTG